MEFWRKFHWLRQLFVYPHWGSFLQPQLIVTKVKIHLKWFRYLLLAVFVNNDNENLPSCDRYVLEELKETKTQIHALINIIPKLQHFLLCSFNTQKHVIKARKYILRIARVPAIFLTTHVPKSDFVWTFFVRSKSSLSRLLDEELSSVLWFCTISPAQDYKCCQELTGKNPFLGGHFTRIITYYLIFTRKVNSSSNIHFM